MGRIQISLSERIEPMGSTKIRLFVFKFQKQETRGNTKGAHFDTVAIASHFVATSSNPWKHFVWLRIRGIRTIDSHL